MAEHQKPKNIPEEYRKKDMGQRVRILSTDVDGTKSLLTGLAKVKGIGDNLSSAIIKKMGMDKKKKLSELSDAEILQIEKAIENLSALGIPVWMYNRRNDLETGKDLHINTSDLNMALKTDFDLLGEIKANRGLRHDRGLKTRGQRTKSTGRGKSAISVIRKKDK
jgi:small subunit ribosomal protein S13